MNSPSSSKSPYPLRQQHPAAPAPAPPPSPQPSAPALAPSSSSSSPPPLPRKPAALYFGLASSPSSTSSPLSTPPISYSDDLVPPPDQNTAPAARPAASPLVFARPRAVQHTVGGTALPVTATAPATAHATTTPTPAAPASTSLAASLLQLNRAALIHKQQQNSSGNGSRKLGARKNSSPSPSSSSSSSPISSSPLSTTPLSSATLPPTAPPAAPAQASTTDSGAALKPLDSLAPPAAFQKPIPLPPVASGLAQALSHHVSSSPANSTARPTSWSSLSSSSSSSSSPSSPPSASSTASSPATAVSASLVSQHQVRQASQLSSPAPVFGSNSPVSPTSVTVPASTATTTATATASPSPSPSFKRSTSFSKNNPPPPLSFKRAPIGTVAATSVATSSPLSILSTSASQQDFRSPDPPGSASPPGPTPAHHLPTLPVDISPPSIATTTVTIPGYSSIASNLSFAKEQQAPPSNKRITTKSSKPTTSSTTTNKPADSELSDSIISLSLYSPRNMQAAQSAQSAAAPSSVKPKIAAIDTSCTPSGAPPKVAPASEERIDTAAAPAQTAATHTGGHQPQHDESDNESDGCEMPAPKNSPTLDLSRSRTQQQDDDSDDNSDGDCNDSEKDNEDLQDASNQNQNIVMELSLDGTIRFLSTSWEDITGYPASDLLNTNISSVIIGDDSDREVFVRAAQAMKDDESSYRVRFLTSKRPLPIFPQDEIPGSPQEEPAAPEKTPARALANIAHSLHSSSSSSSLSMLPFGHHQRQADAVAAVAAAVLSPSVETHNGSNISLPDVQQYAESTGSRAHSLAQSPMSISSMPKQQPNDDLQDNESSFGLDDDDLHNNTMEIHPRGLNIIDPHDDTFQEANGDDDDAELDDVIEIDGQGVLIYHKISGDPSHTMWILRPYVPPKPLSIDLPWKLIQTLGFGVDLLVDYLQSVSEAVISDCDKAPDPPTALCHICEHFFPTWWFERHSELCLVEHKAQSDIETAHENLVDQRNTISQLLTLMDQQFMMAAATGAAAPSPPALPSAPGSSSTATVPSSSASSASTTSSHSPALANLQQNETSSTNAHTHASPISAFSSSSSLVSMASTSSTTSISHKKIEYRGYQLPIFTEVFAQQTNSSGNSSSAASSSPPPSSASVLTLNPSSSPPMSPRLHPSASKSRILAKQLTKQQRQPLKLLELLLGLCDMAVDINKPEIRYYTEHEEGTPSNNYLPTHHLHRSVVFNPSSVASSSSNLSASSSSPNQTGAPCGNVRIHSPHSESNISRVLKWTSPTIDDAGLQLLCKDTEKYAREKVDAVLRLGNTIKYSDTVRKEIEVTVLEVVNDTMEKARQSQMDCAGDMDLEEDEDGMEGNGDADYMSISGGNTNVAPTPDIVQTPVSALHTRAGSEQFFDDETDLEEGSLFSESYLHTDAIPLSATSSRSSGRPGDGGRMRFNRQNSYESTSSRGGRSRDASNGGSGASSTSGSIINTSTSRRISTVRSDSLGIAVTASGAIIIPPSTSSLTSVTPKAILASPYPPSHAYHQNRHHHRLSTGSNDSIDPRAHLERRPTLDSPILDSPLEDLDLTNPLNNLLSTHSQHHSVPIVASSPSTQTSLHRIKSRKSLSNISTLHSPSSYTSSFTSLQRNRIPVTPSSENMQSPSTPLSSPLLFPHDHGPVPGPVELQRRQSMTLSAADFQRQPISPLLTASNPPSKPSQPSIRDYEIINPISRGAFGSVFLARKKLTGEYFAIKVLKKADMVAKNQVKNVRAERAIMMSQSESPFVAKLYFTFQSKSYLYLVMEYLNGGDCAALVKALGGLPEDWAKKYTAEVVVGVQDLHEKGIVHRDLKPDNLLIDKNGHLKLTDFGLSRMGLVGRHTRQQQQLQQLQQQQQLQSGILLAGSSSSLNASEMSSSSSATAMDMMPPPTSAPQAHMSSLAYALASAGASSTASSPGLGLGSLPSLGSATNLATAPRIESRPLTKASTSPEASSFSATRPGSASSTNSMLNSILQDSSISLVPGYFNYSTPTGSSSYKFKPSLTRSESSSSATGEALFIGSTMFAGSRFAAADDEREASVGSIGPLELQRRDSTADTSPTGTAASNSGSGSNNNSNSNSGPSSANHSGTNSAKPIPLFDLTNTNFKFVGTPDYLAPETIRGVGQDEMSDWWSLGCIVFEFIYGYPPFHAETPELVFKNILEHNLQWPSEEDLAEIGLEVSSEANDLISKLLNPDPNARLGAHNGADEIKQHAFFRGINWATLWDEDASFVPVSENPESTDYFDPRGAESQDMPEDMIQPEDDEENNEAAAGDEYRDGSGDVTMSSSAVSSGGSSRTGSFESSHNFIFPAKDPAPGQQTQQHATGGQAPPGQTPQQQQRAKPNYPMPIPPHVRENRIRRSSETLTDDFGSFAFKNLPVLFSANREALDKMKAESLEHRTIIEAAEKKRSRTLSISQIAPPKRPLSPSIAGTASASGNSVASGSSSRMPSPVRQTFSSPSMSMQAAHSPGASSASSANSSNSNSVSSAVLSSSPSSGVSGAAAGAQPGFSPHRKVYPTTSHHGQHSSRSSISGISTSGMNFVPSSPKSSYLSSLSNEIPISSLSGKPTPSSPQASTNFLPPSTGSSSTLIREGSPDLPISELRRHSTMRLSQAFDPSPSSSDNEETALQRVQKRRQISQRGVRMAVPAYRALDVLLCDDNPVMRYTMQTFLRQLGCFVVATASTSDAIRYATGAVKYDIIFTEFKFDKSTGADLVRVLRNTSSRNTNTPVVVVTSYVQEASPQSQQFSSVIEKPPTLNKFVKTLEKLCQWKPRSASINVRSAIEAVAEIAAAAESAAGGVPGTAHHPPPSSSVLVPSAYPLAGPLPRQTARSTGTGSASSGSSVSSSAISSGSTSASNSNSASVSAPSSSQLRQVSSSESAAAAAVMATAASRSASASSSISSASLSSVVLPPPTQPEPVPLAQAWRAPGDQLQDAPMPLPLPRQRGHSHSHGHSHGHTSTLNLKNARVAKSSSVSGSSTGQTNAALAAAVSSSTSSQQQQRTASSSSSSSSSASSPVPPASSGSQNASGSDPRGPA